MQRYNKKLKVKRRQLIFLKKNLHTTYFFIKMFVRACVYKKLFVPLHAFYVYGRVNSTYGSGAQHGWQQGARGDYTDQRMLGMQGQIDVHVGGEPKQGDGCYHARAYESGRPGGGNGPGAFGLAGNTAGVYSAVHRHAGCNHYSGFCYRLERSRYRHALPLRHRALLYRPQRLQAPAADAVQFYRKKGMSREATRSQILN